MIKPGTPIRQNRPVRQPVLLGLFAGTAVGAGYLLSSVPNVELMSLIIALSGAVLGPLGGILCGALSGAIYSLGNPFGPPPPVLLWAQVSGHGIMGLAGWFFGRKMLKSRPENGFFRSHFMAVSAALTGTLVYEVLTNLAIVVMFEDASLMVVLGGAVPFSLIHLGVNALLFGLFFPRLVRRFGQAGQSPLVGRSAVVLMLAVLGSSLAGPDRVGAEPAPADSLSTVATDSVMAAPGPVVPAGPNGWKRPLWNPFSGTTVRWLHNRTNWVTMTDGGLGSLTMVLGEANTSAVPLILRDGIPQGTGHRMADDPGLVSNQSLVFVQQTFGRDGAGGTDGVLNLGTDEKDMTKAISFYRGIKGPHETYMRGISLLTPKTAWRVGFEFDETLDREGYNTTELPDEVFHDGNEFRGHASIRRSRTRLIRHLNEDNSLSLEYSTGRKTKNDLPAIGAEHQEIWNDGAAATAKGRSGALAWRTSLFWNSRTVEWGDIQSGTSATNDRRKLESAREGLVVDLIRSPVDTLSPVADFQTDTGLRDEDFTGPGTGLRLLVSHWDLHDNGAEWQTQSGNEASGDGTNARLAARTGLALGPGRLNFGVFGDFMDGQGIQPGGFVALQQDARKPWWKMLVESGGRAPRSDELLTPLRHVVISRNLYLLPNQSLDFEKTLRANLLLNSRLLGFDIALNASARQLKNGITWRAEPGQDNTGQWHNDLEMTSTRLTASVSRQGRFLGWGRARLEGTWQDFEEKTSKAAFLPPKRYLRMELMWEQHFFREDGIFQLGLLSTYRGEMNDPWDVTRSVGLPPAPTHDLLVGFRLVGASISLNFRNVTDQKVRLSAGAVSPGREMDLRLHWVFLY
jgi:uncharacterized membrane protein